MSAAKAAKTNYDFQELVQDFIVATSSRRHANNAKKVRTSSFILEKVAYDDMNMKMNRSGSLICHVRAFDLVQGD